MSDVTNRSLLEVAIDTLDRDRLVYLQFFCEEVLSSFGKTNITLAEEQFDDMQTVWDAIHAFDDLDTNLQTGEPLSEDEMLKQLREEAQKLREVFVSWLQKYFCPVVVNS